MPPRRQPAKRKAAVRAGGTPTSAQFVRLRQRIAWTNALDLNSYLDRDDGSDDVFVVANKKAKRSEDKAARRSPRLHSEDEDGPARKGRALRPGRGNQGEDDESEYQDGQVNPNLGLAAGHLVANLDNLRVAVDSTG